MQVSYLWLKEFIDFDKSPEEIADILTGLGLECAVGEDRRGWFEGIVTGRVIKKEKHPNADKLSLTQVDVGSEIKKIVCGAPNVAEGQSVVVALAGAVLPGGHAIKKEQNKRRSFRRDDLFRGGAKTFRHVGGYNGTRRPSPCRPEICRALRSV